MHCFFLSHLLFKFSEVVIGIFNSSYVYFTSGLLFQCVIGFPVYRIYQMADQFVPWMYCKLILKTRVQALSHPCKQVYSAYRDVAFWDILRHLLKETIYILQHMPS